MVQHKFFGPPRSRKEPSTAARRASMEAQAFGFRSRTENRAVFARDDQLRVGDRERGSSVAASDDKYRAPLECNSPWV
jgi:hypothetical protein